MLRVTGSLVGQLMIIGKSLEMNKKSLFLSISNIKKDGYRLQKW